MKPTRKELEQLIDYVTSYIKNGNESGMGLSCDACPVQKECDGVCSKNINSALKSLLPPSELPTREEALGQAIEKVKEFSSSNDFFSFRIEHYPFQNKFVVRGYCFFYAPPWEPKCDGTELVFATNKDRPARKGDHIGYLMKIKDDGRYTVLCVHNITTFKNVTPVLL